VQARIRGRCGFLSDSAEGGQREVERGGYSATDGEVGGLQPRAEGVDFGGRTEDDMAKLIGRRHAGARDVRGGPTDGWDAP